MNTLNDFFELGMKRTIPQLLSAGPVAVNLGAGNSPIEGAHNLDLPAWDATVDKIPFDDESVDTIYAFHFLEHVEPIRMLREIERVLKIGGIANIVVPHRLGAIAFQDLDHKHFFTEETWRTLFQNDYYDKHREHPWRLHVHVNVIMGIVERNLALFTQLVKK